MKKILLPLLCGIVLLTSCSKDEDQSAVQNQKIEKRQFIFPDFQLICPSEAAGLTYYIEDCFENTGYENGIPAAMNAFSASGSSLNFTEIDNAEEADIVFECQQTEGPLWSCGQGFASSPIIGTDDSFLGMTMGETVFASGGSIGKYIHLVVAPYRCDCDDDDLDLCFYMGSVMHEVMQVLGFLTNDIEDITEEYDLGGTPIHVEGTTTDPFDPGSVINGPFDRDCDNISCTFSENDIIALMELYPPLPDISGPTVLCTNTETEFCLPDGLVGQWGKKSITVIPPDTSPLPTNCSSYSFSTPGTYPIYVTVDECPITFTVDVFDEIPCFFPSSVPTQFTNVCFEHSPSCFDFGANVDCEGSITAYSSHPKLIVTVEGSTVCLETISTQSFTTNITVSVTPACGPPVSTTYTISVNGEGDCPV